MADKPTGPPDWILQIVVGVLSYIGGLLTGLIPTFNKEIRSFFLKPNLILDNELTIGFGDPNDIENPALVYCRAYVRNEPPKGVCGLFTRRGRATARGSEIRLTARKLNESRQSNSYHLLWPFDDNPKKHDIPNNGWPFRVMLLHINSQSLQMMIPTGPALGQSQYRYSILPPGTYDLTLEVGPPTELTKKEWRNLTLPEGIVNKATKLRAPSSWANS